MLLAHTGRNRFEHRPAPAQLHRPEHRRCDRSNIELSEVAVRHLPGREVIEEPRPRGSGLCLGLSCWPGPGDRLGARRGRTGAITEETVTQRGGNADRDGLENHEAKEGAGLAYRGGK